MRGELLAPGLKGAADGVLRRAGPAADHQLGLRHQAAERLRRRVCAGLVGEVVELGFGSGHNVPFYPAAVTRITAVEPSDLGWRLAAERVKAATVPV